MNYLAQPILQIVDNNGKPLVGGKLYVYDNDTQALADIYSDFEGHSLSNPVILDSLGHAKVLADEDKLYTIIVKNSKDELQFTIENATIVGSGGDITIEGKDFEIYAGNGINVTKSELIGGTIRYDISNNGIDNVDNDVCNFVLGRSNTNDGNYNLIYGRNNKVSDNSEDNIVGGNNNRIENDSNTNRSNIFGSSNNISNSSVDNALVAGDNNELKNVNLHSPIIAGCYNKVEGTGEYKPSDTTVILGKENKLSGSYARSQIIGNYNEDTYGHSSMLGDYNKSSQYGNRIIGSYNTIDGSYSHIIGEYNETSNSSNDKIVGNNNKIDFTGKPYQGYQNILVGYNLNVTDNTNTGNGKIVIGNNNEDNADAFMEIAKNGKNMIEIKHDDKIFFRYNDKMVQLKDVHSDINTLPNDKSNAYTGKSIADYISSAIGGNFGGWLGNLTVDEVNGISNLKSGDYVTLIDSGVITKGNVTVVAGDEIYYKNESQTWDKKQSTYLRSTNYAQSDIGGTIKSTSSNGKIEVNADGEASVYGWNTKANSSDLENKLNKWGSNANVSTPTNILANLENNYDDVNDNTYVPSDRGAAGAVAWYARPLYKFWPWIANKIKTVFNITEFNIVTTNAHQQVIDGEKRFLTAVRVKDDLSKPSRTSSDVYVYCPDEDGWSKNVSLSYEKKADGQRGLYDNNNKYWCYIDKNNKAHFKGDADTVCGQKLVLGTIPPSSQMSENTIYIG